MASPYYTIQDAAERLHVGPDALRRLARKDLISTQVASDGSTLVHVPEAAVALGVEPEDPEDLQDMESATLALIQRRIKRLDIQTERDRLKHKERLGQVIPREDVQRERLTRIRVVRAAILGLARALPSQVEGKSYNEIRAVVDKAARRIISLFAGQKTGEDDDIDT